MQFWNPVWQIILIDFLSLSSGLWFAVLWVILCSSWNVSHVEAEHILPTWFLIEFGAPKKLFSFYSLCLFQLSWQSFHGSNFLNFWIFHEIEEVGNQVRFPFCLTVSQSICCLLYFTIRNTKKQNVASTLCLKNSLATQPNLSLTCSASYLTISKLLLFSVTTYWKQQFSTCSLLPFALSVTVPSK